MMAGDEGTMYVRNIEPSLGELLDDEAARLLMARDGLDPGAVRALMRAAAQRLAEHEVTSAELTHCAS
jgi:hypothetical protein